MGKEEENDFSHFLELFRVSIIFSETLTFLLVIGK